MLGMLLLILVAKLFGFFIILWARDPFPISFNIFHYHGGLIVVAPVPRYLSTAPLPWHHRRLCHGLRRHHHHDRRHRSQGPRGLDF